MSEVQLKACGFCGGEGLTHRVPGGWRVSCKNCDARPLRGLPGLTEAEAIAAWNTRAPTLSGDREDFLWPSEEVFAAQSESERASTLAAYYAHRRLSLPALASPAEDERVRLREVAATFMDAFDAAEEDGGHALWRRVHEAANDLRSALNPEPGAGEGK